MTITRDQIVAEARTWIGTPFVHQAHLKGIGADCLGMVAGVAVALGIYPPDSWATIWKPRAGYGLVPHGGELEAVCQEYLLPLQSMPHPGDVALMRFAQEPQHLGIITPYQHGGLAMVHAYSRAGRVVEHRMAQVWEARVWGYFRFPGVS
jgi:NlpC/P60 family putative phage cell wall peptidase